jgi:hypothetical protein
VGQFYFSVNPPCGSILRRQKHSLGTLASFEWQKVNAPKPKYGQNYHLWLSGQYGLKKLIEHIWMLIGVAKTCNTMTELRDRMAELNGRIPVQMRLYFKP